MNRSLKLAIAVAAVALVAACANNDVYLRPERTTYMKLSEEPSTTVQVAGAPVELTCLDWKGNRATRPVVLSSSLTTETSDIQCLYVSVELKEVANRFPGTDMTTAASGRVKVASAGATLLTPVDEPDLMRLRNIYYSFLRNIADQNCQTFLGRSFANKASIETARSTFQDLLTGSSAAVATAAPPAAAGLSLVNLFAGKTIDNINSTFYYEKTFQAMAGAIAIERERIKREMDSHKEHAYDTYTIFDLINDLRRYDDACSVRVGVTKLQELAQEKQKEQRDEK